MFRFLLLTFAVVSAVAGLHPADSVEARLRSAFKRFAAMDAVLDRACDGPSAVKAIRELNGVEAIPGLTRAYGDRVLRKAPADVRGKSELAVAEAKQRLGRRLAKWYDDGWLTGDDLRRSAFLRMVTASYRRDVESRCEAISKQSFVLSNRGVFCEWPNEALLYELLTETDRGKPYLRPEQLLNPWAGRISLLVVETSQGAKPVAFAKVLTESGWEQISYPSARALKDLGWDGLP